MADLSKIAPAGPAPTATLDPAMMSAEVLLAHYKNKSLSPLEALLAVTERIAAENPTINAFAAMNPQALQAARASTVRWAAGTPEGVQGVLVYMAIYVAMTLGTFACILAMRRDGMLVENIRDLAGLSRTHPTMAFFLAMLLFSLAGVPPLAGFFAKFYVFLAAIKAGLYVLAVIGVITSVVGAYYYLTIVKIMYFDEPVKSFQAMPGLLRLVLAVTGMINILFFVYPAPLLGAATVAAKSLF